MTTTRAMASPSGTLCLLIAAGGVLLAQTAHAQARYDCPEAAVTCVDRDESTLTVRTGPVWYGGPVGISLYRQ